MSFYIAKVLKINPYEILENWSSSQIIVAFGNYINEKSVEAHQIWETNPDKAKRGKEPKKYVVEFVGTYKVGEW